MTVHDNRHRPMYSAWFIIAATAMSILIGFLFAYGLDPDRVRQAQADGYTDQLAVFRDGWARINHGDFRPLDR